VAGGAAARGFAVGVVPRGGRGPLWDIFFKCLKISPLSEEEKEALSVRTPDREKGQVGGAPPQTQHTHSLLVEFSPSL